MSVSFERPLLDEAGPPSDTSEDLEYEPKVTFLSRRARKCRSKRCISPLVALAISTGVFIVGLQSVIIWKLWRQQPSNSLDVIGEINGLVPPVGIKPKLFAPDPSFDPFNSTAQGWLDVMPKGGGFVTVEGWEGKAVPKPIHTHGKDMYNVAVFHQIHCLHMLAEEFNNLLVGQHIGDTSHIKSKWNGGHGGHGGDADKDLMMWHLKHCFEYLKESLTCCADTALEGQKSDTDLPATDGFGAHHVCRNFDEVMSWTEANRVSDQEGYPHGTA
ncbi:Oxidase ustYa-like protein [Cladobotryum mycophilum]|uniref:Oxidase ustYa-like protein n=1 Tax=Cladobotryum mycophilum TaxID=491253 RepID=A0ABR0SX35_9HYPO